MEFRKPQLLLFLREASELALAGGSERLEEEGIDHPEHLQSFIEEVQNPEPDSIPSYLKRFRDFGDVMEAISQSLNLGRNLTETLTRHSLAFELSWNISKLAHRSGSSVFPSHSWITSAREDIPLTGRAPGETVRIENSYLFSVASALLEGLRIKNLRTSAIEEATVRGIFLDFDPVTNKLSESAIHKALVQTLDDIQSLQRLGDPVDWANLMLTRVEDAIRLTRPYLDVDVHDLAMTFSFYNRVENIFNGHLELVKALLGMAANVGGYPRRAITPYGERVEYRIRREHVSSDEVQHLIRNQIWPFGDRPTRDQLGGTPQEQIKTLADIMRRGLENTSVGGQIDRKSLEARARKLLNDLTAGPDEGIENLPPHPDDHI